MISNYLENKPQILFPWNDESPPFPIFKIMEAIVESGGEIYKLNFMDPEIDCRALTMAL